MSFSLVVVSLSLLLRCRTYFYCCETSSTLPYLTILALGYLSYLRPRIQKRVGTFWHIPPPSFGTKIPCLVPPRKSVSALRTSMVSTSALRFSPYLQLVNKASLPRPGAVRFSLSHIKSEASTSAPGHVSRVVKAFTENNSLDSSVRSWRPHFPEDLPGGL